MVIRPVREDDLSATLDIYTYYTENTAISFDYAAPTMDEWREKMRRTLEKYPYFVAEEDGKILGYTYVSPFKGRPAYDWSVETTIYVAPDCRAVGVGRALYEALEKALKAQGITNMYACIGVPEVDDEYLTHDSVYFHEKMGFTLCGTFRKCGRKFDRWYDMVWMEKIIGEYF